LLGREVHGSHSSARNDSSLRARFVQSRGLFSYPNNQKWRHL
jgi:hypothetical protein